MTNWNEIFSKLPNGMVCRDGEELIDTFRWIRERNFTGTIPVEVRVDDLITYAREDGWLKDAPSGEILISTPVVRTYKVWEHKSHLFREPIPFISEAGVEGGIAWVGKLPAALTTGTLFRVQLSEQAVSAGRPVTHPNTLGHSVTVIDTSGVKKQSDIKVKELIGLKFLFGNETLPLTVFDTKAGSEIDANVTGAFRGILRQLNQRQRVFRVGDSLFPDMEHALMEFARLHYLVNQ